MKESDRHFAWEWAFRALVPLSLFLGGWVIRSEIKAQNHEERIERVEQSFAENRATLNRVADTLNELKVAIAHLEERRPK